MVTHCRDVLNFYAGNGCRLAPCCFKCALPDCKISDAQHLNNVSKYGPQSHNYDAMSRAVVGGGQTFAEVARLYGVSSRTVRRAVAAMSK